MPEVLTCSLFVLGAFFCGLNFYLSFLRVPLLRLLRLLRYSGVPPGEIRNVTGAPLLGSLFVLTGLSNLHVVPGVLPLGIGLILIDTGGPHWFVGTLVSVALRDWSRKDRTPPV